MKDTMKILVVCSHRKYISDGIAPFIKEQMESIIQLGVDCDYFLINGKGVIGYLKNYRAFLHKIKTYKPDIIHAHYGLCGLFANLQRRIPVVTTYHGSDINNAKVRRYSKISIWLSTWNIFVCRSNMALAGCVESSKRSLIPCGIDDTLFVPMSKQACRKQLGLAEKVKYVLFTKQFTNHVKNYPLAKVAVDLVNSKIQRKTQQERTVKMLEFTGYSREQSVLLMNAVDVVIMTSISEGSPQVIKEAMACGCPIVSVDVGDVRERIDGIDGCFLAKSYEPTEMAGLLEKALAFTTRTNGRNALEQQGLFNRLIAQRLCAVYKQVIRN